MLKISLRTILLASATPLMASAALASPDCTKEPKDKWLSEGDMKTKVEALGYTKFDKVLTSGNCYEIYAVNKDGKKVEVYFNPVDGAVVEEEIED